MKLIIRTIEICDECDHFGAAPDGLPWTHGCTKGGFALSTFDRDGDHVIPVGCPLPDHSVLYREEAQSV